MGLYISFDDVKKRTIGKVAYTTNEAEENKMQVSLTNVLINEAEAQVELDLSPRYEAPFQTLDGGSSSFSALPDRPTKLVIRTLCELQAVMRICQTDYGRGGINNAEKYYESQAKLYDRMLKQLLEHRDGYGSGWKYPPLPGLKLMWGNSAADTGYVGEVIVTGAGDDSGMDYPNRRINDPSKTLWAPYGIRGLVE